MFSKLKNLFKVTRTISIDDTGNYQYTISTFLGKTQKTMSLKPYGLISNPPVPSLGATFANQGDEADLISIVDDPNNRPRGLLPGEVGLSNFVTGDIFKMETTGIVSLITTLFNITGDINLTGNLTATGNITGLNLTASALLTAANLNVSGTISGDIINATTSMSTPVLLVGVVNMGTHTHLSNGPGNQTGPPV